MPPTLATAAAGLAACSGAPGPQGYGMALLQGGAVHGCNGPLYGRMPAPLPPTLPPLAVPAALLRAACAALPPGAAPTLTHTATHLRITCGAFTARLPTVPAHEITWVPATLQDAQLYMPPNVRRALQLCAPFMERRDAGMRRDWMCGVRIQEGYVLATDGIAAIRAPGTLKIAAPMPPCTLPYETVLEINRRITAIPAEELPGIAISDQHATFHFHDGSVLRSSLIAGSWPRTPDELFAPIRSATMQPYPQGLLEAVRAVMPFAMPETRPLVHLQPRGAVVAAQQAYADEDASMDGFPSGILNGTFQAEHLCRVLELAPYIQFTETLCCWRGDDGVEGLLIGTKG